MSNRSVKPEIRNPVLALPSIAMLLQLPPEARAAVAEILKDLARDARARAQKSWRQNKGPMAAYWKAVGAYADHTRRAIRPERRLP